MELESELEALKAIYEVTEQISTCLIGLDCFCELKLTLPGLKN